MLTLLCLHIFLGAVWTVSSKPTQFDVLEMAEVLVDAEIIERVNMPYYPRALRWLGVKITRIRS